MRKSLTAELKRGCRKRRLGMSTVMQRLSCMDAASSPFISGLVHMKRLLAATSALTVLALASQASAADLAARAAPLYAKAPEYVAVNNWNGWYVGGNVGWTGGSNSLDSGGVATGGQDPANAAALVQSASQHFGASSGAIGGGQIGFNYRISPSVIVGFETDLQGLGTSHKASSAFGAIAGNADKVGILTSMTASYEPSYLGTFRARLGTTVTPSLLLYATGGLAFGQVRSSTTLTPTLINGTPFSGDPGPNELTPSSSGSSSNTRVGYAAGFGAEWMFASNWSTKLEYLHYDLGSVSYSTGGLSFDENRVGNISGGGIAAASTSTAVHFRNELVRVGVNYHFH
jgi:outer membrane immunogenic protein